MAERKGRQKRKRSPTPPTAPPSRPAVRIPAHQRPPPASSASAQQPAISLLVSPPLSPTSLPASVLAALSSPGSTDHRSRAHTRWLIVRANREHAAAERVVMRAELEMLRVEERRLREEKERLLDEVMRREMGERAEALIKHPSLPTDGAVPPWLLHLSNGNRRP
ncbi:hypothetical protein CALCODRAFT_487498 [Calocera cornea HHB12733]|uniref:Uncharacterized protein n=1 Tax=Calocera cornea HHB12733 TaxID=1353952 RepID=A0A165D2W3_9BASI|nr:hypothetical protein CALCODRAFT_487498 [Calocera cornea HHB12733]